LRPGFRRLRCSVQVRYNHAPIPAIVELEKPGIVRVCFDRPVTAVCPGQAAVFYSGARLLGGGWIDRALEMPARMTGAAEETIQ